MVAWTSHAPTADETDEDADALARAQRELGALEAYPGIRQQLEHIARELDGAHALCIELGSSVDGCQRFGMQLRSGQAYSFLAGILARRRADAAKLEAERAATEASLRTCLHAVFGSESMPWYQR